MTNLGDRVPSGTDKGLWPYLRQAIQQVGGESQMVVGTYRLGQDLVGSTRKV